MKKIRKLTLVPAGGLGNRMLAISSAIIFCQAKNMDLTIIWFKDNGLNCDYHDLFTINPHLKNIHIRNNNISDLILRDNPRRKNLWMPLLFEKREFDICFYYHKNNLIIQNENPFLDTSLDRYDNIFLVACDEYWKSEQMFNNIIISNDIIREAKTVIDIDNRNIIGLHIRRTDNWVTLKYSPTELYIRSIEKELISNPDSLFYLASDCIDEKKKLVEIFGDKIVTRMKDTNRNTKQGIKDALIDMVILASSQKIYAGQSSFAFISSRILGRKVPCYWLDIRLTQSNSIDSQKVRFHGM